jgi:hypothetical protein
MVGTPGFDPGRLQQSAAPVYKTEPHTSADAVQRMRAILSSSQRMGRNAATLTALARSPARSLSMSLRYRARPSVSSVPPPWAFLGSSDVLVP